MNLSYLSKIITSLEFSKDARYDKDFLEKKFKNQYFKFLEDKETDTQGFLVINNEGEMTISFRGTQQRRDWLTDLTARHVKYELVIPYGNTKSDIRVHKGFNRAYKSIRDTVHAEIINNNPKKITVDGFSLGGSLAVLCSVDIQYNFGDIVEAFPNANPRVGNKAFARSYNKRVKCIRTYHRADFVPKLPPRWYGKFLYGGYCHVSKSFAFGRRFPLVGLIQQIKYRKKSDFGLDDIVNHDIDMYIRKIKKIKESFSV